MKTVDYTASSLLSCAKCNGTVVLCVSDTLTADGMPFLEATVASTTEMWDTCGNLRYLYGFTYDAADLADPTYSLVSTDIDGAFCKGCLTTYIEAIGTPPLAYILSLLAPYFDHICLVTTEAELIAAIANVNCNHIVIGAPFTLTANRTIPSTKCLTILNGCSVTTNAHVLSIEGPFSTGIYQCFITTAGEVQFNSTYVEQVYPQWFGAVADGLTDTTAAIAAALASLVLGGIMFLPKGTYRIQRGNGGLVADNIVYNNTTIRGTGLDTVIAGLNAANTVPNNRGNEYYNAFQATSKSNITIEKLSLIGYLTLVSAFSCTGVTVNEVYTDGWLNNAGMYLRDKSVYFSKSTEIRCLNSKFINGNFEVYFGGTGSGANACGVCLVDGCFFENTLAAGTYDNTFPVGVYAYYVDKVIVTRCRFKNIYSSLDSGTLGTGMGYGVYEGDGSANAVEVSDCIFEWTVRGLKRAIGILISKSIQTVISNNIFSADANSNLIAGVYLDYKVNNQRTIVEGNTALKTSNTTFSQAFMSYAAAKAVTIYRNNLVRGWNIAFYVGIYAQATSISGNICEDQDQYGIQVEGPTNSYIGNTQIANNIIQRAGLTGIALQSFVVGVQIIGNTILDCNQDNVGGTTASGIRMHTGCYGSLMANNVIGNTPVGNGHIQFGISFTQTRGNRIFKDIFSNNSFIALANGLGYYECETAMPTNGIFDISKGDFIINSDLDAAETPGWYCVAAYRPTLSANASNASLTVTVSSTAGMQSGDRVLLCKSTNPYVGDDYYNSNDWHADVINNVTGPTTFTLTTGIPVGDGTYVAGTAAVVVARFKAAAVIDA